MYQLKNFWNKTNWIELNHHENGPNAGKISGWRRKKNLHHILLSQLITWLKLCTVFSKIAYCAPLLPPWPFKVTWAHVSLYCLSPILGHFENCFRLKCSSWSICPFGFITFRKPDTTFIFLKLLHFGPKFNTFESKNKLK